MLKLKLFVVIVLLQLMQCASNSYHIKGKAIDFRIAGVPLTKVKAAAENLSNGGVGYYPTSNFIHVDTGPVRTWKGV